MVLSLYLVFLLWFFIIEFWWSFNKTSKNIGNLNALPKDGGTKIMGLTLLLFFICLIYGTFLIKWWLFPMPWIITFINSRPAYKKAIQEYVKENLKMGISKKETIKMIIEYQNQFNLKQK